MRKKFDYYCNYYLSHRSGIDVLLDYLADNDYFTSPSSTHYHGAEEGGNFTHSVLVADTILELREAIAPEVSAESCVLVALFHDVGKATYYGKPNYLPNILKGGKVSEAKPYVSNTSRLPIPHQVASIHILAQFIELTEEETYAILYHNGLYTPDGKLIQGNETKLLMLLHWADMWASRFLENRDKAGEL